MRMWIAGEFMSIIVMFGLAVVNTVMNL